MLIEQSLYSKIIRFISAGALLYRKHGITEKMIPCFIVVYILLSVRPAVLPTFISRGGFKRRNCQPMQSDQYLA